MKDINLEFQQVLVAHGIIKNVTLDAAIEAAKRLEQNYLYGKRIALYGCGIEADKLLMFLAKYAGKIHIVHCFDRLVRNYQYKEMVSNTTVNSIEEIRDKNIDCIVLGSYRFRKELILNLNKLGYQGEVFDLYMYLEDYIGENFSDYEELFHMRQRYEKADGENKYLLLRQLIKQYLLIKDFCSAFYSIEVYCHNQYPDFEKYLNLKISLEKFLHDIKVYINNRNEKDIIWNWVDALSYSELHKFPFLNRKADIGVHFKNTYTAIPWTTELKKATLCGEYPIEGKLFLRDKLSKDNMRLLNILSENGYDFGYCGMSRFAKLFDTSVAIPETFYEKKHVSSMQRQWDALTMLCKSEKPMCILIHTCCETHEPFVCGEGSTFIQYESSIKDWEQEDCQKQAEVSGKYIDRELEFYEQFYGKSATQIYMSDHGRVGNSPMDENKIHSILFINRENIKKEEVEGIFSLARFPDLIENIIKGERDWDVLADDYAIIENLDAYSESLVNKTLSGRFSREEMYQCRGVITRRDKYFLYEYGKEYYFASLTSMKNEIDNPLYAGRIAELRDLCGKEFIDIYKYEKFKYSRLLYSAEE